MSFALRVALAFASIIGLAASLPYFWIFDGGISSSSQKWANFGGYIGGTLGPIYALLAFAVGVQAILDNRQQNVRQGLLSTLHRYEADFESACIRTVTCESPWIWGNMPSETNEVKTISLRTLLYSDSVDWEQHLPQIVDGCGYQILQTGEISQDREVILRAHQALEGLFSYLALFKSAGGDAALVSYLESRYEIPSNRIEAAFITASNSLC